jgi:hypothetical protein
VSTIAKKPPFRKLRGYAFDPSLSLNIETALINNITYKIPWEHRLGPGPCGEYVEVIDYDPTVKKWYEPVDLNHLFVAAQDGLEPSGSNPQFHQQMVYAVAMTTIKNFEAALGRPVLWSPRKKVVKKANATKGKNKSASAADDTKIVDEFVRALRIYPHALRDANAFYSPQKKALLFGYFAARPADVTLQMPDNLTFTCLSHDIIAHETTHAILDGLYRKYVDDTNPDVLAFHEAFADVIALFQHFTFPDVLKNQIAATRGDLTSQNLLGKLAQEFGIAIGNYGSLRDAIGEIDPETNQWKPHEPTGDEYRTIMEPHARGAILVSAIFEAFLTIYKSRVKDLLRIASDGTGVLPQGELHPDLVNRLAAEASKTAGHVLKMCIRAIDFCPPVDITYGDFLRAIITADLDLVKDDSRDYRISFIDAFRKRGIYPTGIKNLSVESLCYSQPDLSGMDEQIKILTDFLREFRADITYVTDREEIFNLNRDYIAGRYNNGDRSDGGKQKTNGKKKEKIPDNILGLHRRLYQKFQKCEQFEVATGLSFNQGVHQKLGISTSEAYRTQSPSFEVHSLHFASRVGPNGNQTNQVIVTLIQRALIEIKKDRSGNDIAVASNAKGAFELAGGCTLIFDLDTLSLKYAISKSLLDQEALRDKNEYRINLARAMQIQQHQFGNKFGANAYKAYFALAGGKSIGEPFAFLHTH